MKSSGVRSSTWMRDFTYMVQTWSQSPDRCLLKIWLDGNFFPLSVSKYNLFFSFKKIPLEMSCEKCAIFLQNYLGMIILGVAIILSWGEIGAAVHFTKGLWTHKFTYEKSSCGNSDSDAPIRSKFPTCHDSSAVVTFVKFWPDLLVILTWIFTRFWIINSLFLCKMVPRDGYVSMWLMLI